MHQAIAENVRLLPVEQLILVATMTGNVQRASRPHVLPDAVRGRAPLSVGLIVPMSRHAVARATGPMQTKRRTSPRSARALSGIAAYSPQPAPPLLTVGGRAGSC